MFNDRFDAARQLAPLLKQYKSDPNAIILAIPRGGLELGSVLAHKLHLPLDIILSKKIGFPGNPEAAIGAVSEKHVFVDERFKNIAQLQEYIAQEVTKIRTLLAQRNKQYREGMPPFTIQNKTVIVVDDGVATGNTLLATLALIKQYNPHKIIVALPVAPPDILQRLKEMADEVVCLEVPTYFISVGQFYKQFNQVDDQEAIRLLHEANR